MTNNRNRVACVDIFCGVGGLTHGLVRGGIHVAAGVDVDDNCRFAYERNNASTFVHRDVRNVGAQDLNKWFGKSKLRLLAGCAPCQSFSTYSRVGRKGRSDNLWPLLSEFGRLVREAKPDLVTMENVPQLAHHAVFEEFLGSFEGYHVAYAIVETLCMEFPKLGSASCYWHRNAGRSNSLNLGNGKSGRRPYAMQSHAFVHWRLVEKILTIQSMLLADYQKSICGVFGRRSPVEPGETGSTRC